MIEGLGVSIGSEAVVVRSVRPLSACSSAVFHGGLVEARAVVNLHVRKNDSCADPPAILAAYARRTAVPEPYVGLLTSAWTEHAVVSEASGSGMTALAVVTVGLSNRVAAGRVPVLEWIPDTINTIVVVDADAEAAALVNAIITATEVKVLALAEAGIRDADGAAVSGTFTDAVVVAATGRGPLARFGGPASELGWTVAQAVREALTRGIREWKERNP
jgi:adenosylcobinamide amidohydrolase